MAAELIWLGMKTAHKLFSTPKISMVSTGFVKDRAEPLAEASIAIPPARSAPALTSLNTRRSASASDKQGTARVGLIYRRQLNCLRRSFDAAAILLARQTLSYYHIGRYLGRIHSNF